MPQLYRFMAFVFISYNHFIILSQIKLACCLSAGAYDQL